MTSQRYLFSPLDATLDDSVIIACLLAHVQSDNFLSSLHPSAVTYRSAASAASQSKYLGNSNVLSEFRFLA
jgi:hypothetical protein